jgi:hypothetical protein
VTLDDDTDLRAYGSRRALGRASACSADAEFAKQALAETDLELVAYLSSTR